MMESNLIRYWFEFEYDNFTEIPIGLGLGCGVTAYSYEDALTLLKTKVFSKKPIAPFKKVIEHVDVSTLEANHVLLNMSTPTIVRGIWYPNGYSDFF